MSIKNKLKDSVNSIVKTVAYDIFTKAVIGIVFALIGIISLFCKNIFDINNGNSLIISCVLTLSIYIIYKIAKRIKNKQEKIENQTLWDKMGISKEMRLTLIGIAQRCFLIGFFIIYSLSIMYFGIERAVILLVIFVAILICCKYKLHVKLYDLTASKIKSHNKAKYAYAFRNDANIVCKNCGTLISRKDKICFNCGLKVNKKSKTLLILLFLIFIAAVFMRFV
ncbi:MAG: hypothetical protein LBD84_04625 [Campylobacteraceae bacterium]|jgi:hypothetical protein|nr:hypothetical protein [Campylobacteraceae bacterium]